MSNDEQPFGLAYLDSMPRSKIVTKKQKDTSITPAKPLEFEDEGKIASIDNLLKQIRDGSEAFLEQNSHLGNTLLRNKAILCNGMAGGFLQAEEDSKNEGNQELLGYEGCEHSLLMAAYFYHDLTSLNHQDNENLVNAMLKRQAGPRRVEAERERGREWMRERAKEIWRKDHVREKRLTEVAAEVKTMTEERKRSSDRSVQHWALSLERIKKAISSVAPEYARRKGRPSKK